MTPGEHDASVGIARAKSAEDKVNPGFTQRALTAIHVAAQLKSEVHIDDLCRLFNEQAIHVNVWGSIWRTARKLGFIEPTGEWRKARELRIKHARKYPVYKSLIFKEAA